MDKKASRWLWCKNSTSHSWTCGHLISLQTRRCSTLTCTRQRQSLLSRGWRQKIEEMERDFEAREILFTDEIREQRLNEIAQKRDELEQFVEEKFGPRGDYFARQKELPEPIQRLIFYALTPVASRENFDFVFDRAEDPRFLYTRQEWN